MSPTNQENKYWVRTIRGPENRGFATLREAYEFADYAEEEGHVGIGVFIENEDGGFTAVNRDGSTTG